ncbi:lignin-forming anionic peroxidase-like [Carya illinoinensis]|uniref:lignin-forming anionic peroxidase-like n=1 Tax=Carya illinoinensis TaxID=32201 RepID=UPI001C71B115|nr:lignin-forming anionic peroxidase-like [Carya illinoinensis]
MEASLIRLHFHDFFVQGCDASILLDDTPSILGEKTAQNNAGSVRGYEVIDDVKCKVENLCPGVVSCHADILAVVAQDASVAVGRPTAWTLKLGKRDSTTASLGLSTETNLPKFTDGLDRIHENASDIDAGFASTRKRKCSLAVGNEDAKIAPLDLVTPNSFDNNYFKNLTQKKGLLKYDQILYSGGSTDSIVTEYSKGHSTFKDDFAAAMVKTGDIDLIIGSQRHEIRKLCSAVN